MDTVSKDEYEELEKRFEYLIKKPDITNEELAELGKLTMLWYIYDTEQERAGE